MGCKFKPRKFITYYSLSMGAPMILKLKFSELIAFLGFNLRPIQLTVNFWYTFRYHFHTNRS